MDKQSTCNQPSANNLGMNNRGQNEEWGDIGKGNL